MRPGRFADKRRAQQDTTDNGPESAVHAAGKLWADLFKYYCRGFFRIVIKNRRLGNLFARYFSNSCLIVKLSILNYYRSCLR